MKNLSKKALPIMLLLSVVAPVAAWEWPTVSMPTVDLSAAQESVAGFASQHKNPLLVGGGLVASGLALLGAYKLYNKNPKSVSHNDALRVIEDKALNADSSKAKYATGAALLASLAGLGYYFKDAVTDAASSAHTWVTTK